MTTKKGGRTVTVGIDNCGSSARLTCLSSASLQRCLSSAAVVVPKGCGSSAKLEVRRVDNGEELPWKPDAGIDSTYELELRLLLLVELLSSKGKASPKQRRAALSKPVALRTRKDFDALDLRFKAARGELKRLKRSLGL